MADAIDAVYENGVFKPLEPIHMEDGRKVRLSVEAVRTDSNMPDAYLRGWEDVYAGLDADEVRAVEEIALDRGRFMDAASE